MPGSVYNNYQNGLELT